MMLKFLIQTMMGAAIIRAFFSDAANAGPVGPRGLQGIQGIVGPKGDKGDPGEPGVGGGGAASQAALFRLAAGAPEAGAASAMVVSGQESGPTCTIESGRVKLNGSIARVRASFFVSSNALVAQDRTAYARTYDTSGVPKYDSSYAIESVSAENGQSITGATEWIDVLDGESITIMTMQDGIAVNSSSHMVLEFDGSPVGAG